jgi:hypothetical protein
MTQGPDGSRSTLYNLVSLVVGAWIAILCGNAMLDLIETACSRFL